MSKIRLLLIFLLLFFSVNISFSQNIRKDYFRQPLNGKLLVADNFCEFRLNHFHAGLDFRARYGTPVYAAADGYISRIKVSPIGYGNAIYITHPVHLKTVYGHLSAFSSDIAAWVHQQQYSLHTFALDTNLNSSVFPVKKGQIIGYVGNSGRSYAPHLHFEIRNLDDEPINPLLFGFKIKDTRPPVATYVAIYPYKNQGTVNGKNYSRLYAVKNNTIAAIPVVSGKIFFGIEAFDYNNDVGNRNAPYSTKLFIDDTLVYFSEFDSISYLVKRDVNSMVDYKRRILSGKRIQRCYVEPGNELYHYKIVKNHGIIDFIDNNVHNVRFVIQDVNKNTEIVKFKVRSSNKNFVYLPRNECVKYFRYDTVNTYENKGLKLILPEKSLFDDLCFNYYSSVGNDYSPVFHIGNEFVPLKSKILLFLNISLVPDKMKDKLVVVHKSFNGMKKYYTGEIDGSYIKTEIDVFGRYYLDTDLHPPKIKALNIQNGKKIGKQRDIRFIISDDKSGIYSWDGFINGKWVLFSYDQKNHLLKYKIDKNVKKGSNILKLTVRDKVGNAAEYRVSFIL